VKLDTVFIFRTCLCEFHGSLNATTTSFKHVYSCGESLTTKSQKLKKK